MSEIKLNKTQKTLVAVWQNEVNQVLRSVNQMANELLAMKLESMAKDVGIDLENENWSFDAQGMRFYKQEETRDVTEKVTSVTPVIPSRKRGRPRKEDVIDVKAEEVIEAEDTAELPFDAEPV
jgi:hypothetical protein